MQQGIWQRELLRVAVPVGLGLAAGWSVDYPLPGLLVGMAAAHAMSLRAMANLYRWSHRFGSPPQDSGLVGYSVDRIVRREKNLRSKLSQQARQLRRYNEGLESLQDGVLIIDAEGYITNFNSAAVRLLGLRNEDLGQHVKNLLRTPKFTKYFDRGDYSKAQQFDFNHVRPQTLMVQITQFGVDQKVMLVRDVTERKRVETMRQNFIADVSHELRTPLTVINGYLEMLQDMELPASLNKALGQMSSQGERMQSLVNDLIELSRLESANSDSAGDYFNLQHLAHSVIDQLQSYDHNTVSLQCEVDVEVQGFVDEMRTVLSNLLTNAYKYGGDGEVQLTIENAAHGVRVSVSDQGDGIAAEHLTRLTERFYRVDDSRESSVGGSGLGLAITKHALEHHGAQLEIESEIGKGSTFSFVIPAERVQPA
ncbi:phosphate regulon sensor histidine kinase PhoR [Bacterioplanes sanyensis]|uniref:Phosphate regulon sensor protein PhoR n=1 Tax=Bacterioplanes sanyensis TaxID=1249553 RepID=A0A222FGZ4_9GAMM|nr:phosphate regulon sensor histidine kinase PhoR [Bacterioplanes sanyensis]ASP38020.1 phosphate regulon sensor histidine kinase PhoR [Bacterioplanes sanyensis]